MNTGLVIKSTGSAIGVLTSEGENVDCRIKGNLRIAGIRSTNPVAVGDQVTIERQTVRRGLRRYCRDGTIS